MKRCMYLLSAAVVNLGKVRRPSVQFHRHDNCGHQLLVDSTCLGEIVMIQSLLTRGPLLIKESVHDKSI